MAGSSAGSLSRDRYYSVYGQPRILCCGDSITLGTGDVVAPQAGYRLQLRSILPFWTAVGDIEGGDGTSIGNEYHHGVGGTGIDALNIALPTILNAATTGRIDIVLLHIGTNSAAGLVDTTPDIGSRVATACATIAARNPGCRFIIANPLINFKSTNGQPIKDAWAVVNASVATAITGIPRAVACPMPTIPDSEFSDGVHPLHAGYLRMALQWRTTLTQLGYCL